RLLGQLLVGVAPVAQDARVAVDLGDAAGAEHRGAEGRVVEPDVREQLAPLGGVDAAVGYRDLHGITTAIVRDRDAVGHGRVAPCPGHVSIRRAVGEATARSDLRVTVGSRRDQAGAVGWMPGTSAFSTRLRTASRTARAGADSRARWARASPTDRGSRPSTAMRRQAVSTQGGAAVVGTTAGPKPSKASMVSRRMPSTSALGRKVTPASAAWVSSSSRN